MDALYTKNMLGDFSDLSDSSDSESDLEDDNAAQVFYCITISTTYFRSSPHAYMSIIALLLKKS